MVRIKITTNKGVTEYVFEYMFQATKKLEEIKQKDKVIEVKYEFK